MKIVFVCLFLCIFFVPIKAQIPEDYINSIPTAVSFLEIETDARIKSFGDIGVVSSEKYYETGLSQNPALLSRNKKVAGGKVSYLSYLNNLISGVNLVDIKAYYSINENNAFGIKFNHFDLGDIQFFNANGDEINSNPKDWYLGVNYAHSFSSNFSSGIGLKYIKSDPFKGLSDSLSLGHAAESFAFDIGFNYRNSLIISENSDLKYSIGLSVLNVGEKISYLPQYVKIPLPTDLKFGIMGEYSYQLFNNFPSFIIIAYQASKLLVPSWPVYENVNGDTVMRGKDPIVPLFKGMAQSFNDAPYGAEEEWHEIMHLFGFETGIEIKNITISIRFGKSYEHQSKGNRNYFTYGLGLAYNNVTVDFSNTYQKDNIFNGTKGLSLGYNYQF